MKRLWFLIPLAAFFALAAVLAVGLKLDPREVPSPLIDKPAPKFALARLDDAGKTELKEGRILQRGITPCRSFVSAPMRYGRMFLAGDACHIVPPTGAKGLNLAVADIRVLARALIEFFKSNKSDRLDSYSDTALRRIWKAVRYSTYMTNLLHRPPDQTPFDREIQVAELNYILSSHAAQTTIAENYVGLPFEED